MALSLILRRSNNIQALPSLLSRNVAGIKNIGSFAQIPNKTVSHILQKGTLTKSTAIQNLSKPVSRQMSAGGDHRFLWTVERLVSVSLAGIIPLTLAFPNMLFDNLCAIAVGLHIHWGLEACVVDYIRPIIFGSVIPKVSLALLYVVTALTVGGLLYFNYTDIGIGKSIRKLWAIK